MQLRPLGGSVFLPSTFSEKGQQYFHFKTLYPRNCWGGEG